MATGFSRQDCQIKNAHFCFLSVEIPDRRSSSRSRFDGSLREPHSNLLWLLLSQPFQPEKAKKILTWKTQTQIPAQRFCAINAHYVAALKLFGRSISRGLDALWASHALDIYTANRRSVCLKETVRSRNQKVRISAGIPGE